MRSWFLEREQWLPKPPDEIFAFFADARNLAAITPPWLGFRILSPEPVRMHAGTRILYRIRWRGLPLRWVTSIEVWEPPFRLVDVQRQGPYALWHHTHEFEPHAGGTRMRDRVCYGLPFGSLGALLHGLVVRKDLEAIFAYRARRVDDIFTAWTGPARVVP